MRLRTFAILDAVLQTGSFAAAAVASNLTTSAVSLQMKALEQFLGQQLFDRSGPRVSPLPAAHDVARIMREARGELDDFRRATRASVEGTLKLGMVEAVQTVLLPGMMQALRGRHPDLRVSTRRGKSLELTQAVKAGQLDAAVVSRPESGGSSRLRWLPLFVSPLYLTVPPDAPDGDPDTLFRRYEWIRYDTGTIAGRTAARYVQGRFASWHGALEFDSARAILALVSRGIGLSVIQLLEPEMRLLYPVRALPLPDAPPIRFALVTRMNDGERRPLQVLQELLVDAVDVRGRARLRNL